jgi:hypothetical protein
LILHGKGGKIKLESTIKIILIAKRGNYGKESLVVKNLKMIILMKGDM